ncbi:Gfo/Idh/MocA family oxidoreductase [Alicyclobacillus curvatus]|jgi:predicted dehydrogenase|nr:Gfo/Idh/MocA family oxidoreductase [Alicyclobacillus curvatus]
MVKVAVVGVGWQGQTHVKTLLCMQNVDVVGLCDLDAACVRSVAAKFRVNPYSDYEGMLDAARPDAIVICTPPAVRLQLVEPAATRGIHCFIEKPPAKDLATARDVDKILQRSGVLHAVGFMFRYGRAVESCRQLIVGRRVALVRSAMLDGLALRPNWPRWFFDKARSGGPIFDQGIHLVDLSRYLLGEVDSVAGFQGNLVVPKSADFTVEDSATCLFRYQRGTLQNHTHAWAVEGFRAEMELISDELQLTLDLGGKSLRGNIAGEEVNQSFPEDDYYGLELEAFVEAVESGDRSVIRSTYTDSVASLRTTLAAVKALEESCVVTLE